MGNYYTLVQARADGITVTEGTDDQVTEEINRAEEILEKWTGRKFYARDLTLHLDGTGSEFLDLVRYRPINTITSIVIDDETIDIDNYIAIYIEEGFLRIKREGWSVFSGNKRGYYSFSRGSQNIDVVGNFGYESVPYNIKYIIKKMVFRELRPNTKVGKYQSEHSGNYGYQLNTPSGSGGRKGEILTGDPELDRLIHSYKHKISFKAITRGCQ
jgi:hypothetical protein